MNLAVPPFDDVHVRRAVNLAYEADRWIRVANRHVADIFGFGPLGHVAPDATEDDLLRGERLYPFDPAAAREEMARSRYDGNRDGICDDPACKDVFALETDAGFEKFADRVWVEDLKAIGITLDIRRVADPDKYTQMSLDPTTKVALNLGGSWTADYPNASNLFVTLFTSEGIGGRVDRNESLVGVSPHDLRRWGYGVTQVPNVDPEIDKCLAFFGFAQTRCWAELDQLLMTRVVPWVPQDTFEFLGGATRSVWFAPRSIRLSMSGSRWIRPPSRSGPIKAPRGSDRSGVHRDPHRPVPGGDAVRRASNWDRVDHPSLRRVDLGHGALQALSHPYSAPVGNDAHRASTQRESRCRR